MCFWFVFCALYLPVYFCLFGLFLYTGLLLGYLYLCVVYFVGLRVCLDLTLLICVYLGFVFDWMHIVCLLVTTFGEFGLVWLLADRFVFSCIMGFRGSGFRFDYFVCIGLYRFVFCLAWICIDSLCLGFILGCMCFLMWVLTKVCFGLLVSFCYCECWLFVFNLLACFWYLCWNCILPFELGCCTLFWVLGLVLDLSFDLTCDWWDLFCWQVWFWLSIVDFRFWFCVMIACIGG